MVGERKGWFEGLARLPVILLALLFITPYAIVVQQAFGGWYANLGPYKTGNFLRAMELHYLDTPFLHLMGNSLLVTLGSAGLGVFFAAAAAYVLSRFSFMGRELVFLVIVGSMLFPWQVTLIPNFVAVRDLGWMNSYWALLVPAIPKAFAVFLLRQQMLSLPNAYLESARIDGAGELRIWWQIVLPILRPAMLAAFLLLALSEWNSYLWPYLVADDGTHTTLPVAINRMSGEAGTYPAMLILTMLPPTLFFMGFQRALGQGLGFGGALRR